MSNINDTATVTLLINGEHAKKVIEDMKVRLEDAKKKLNDLKEAKASPKDIKKASQEVKKLERELENARTATETVREVLQNLDNVSPRQLQKTLSNLKRQFNNAKQGSEAYQILAQQIRVVQEQLTSVNEELKESQSLWEQFKSWAEGSWAAIDLLVRGGEALFPQLNEYVEAFSSMDQEMANVRKFTGMTSDEVGILNDEFKKMDTRTSREELNKLAQEAGRLGKQSVEDVLGFVRAADKINVALDDLGEGATLTLSKLTGVFGVEDRFGTEQSLLKVGSVINELSQNCAASAPYLTNFTERMAGVGAQANMTIPQIMGYAAVLDSSSQAVESSATALAQVLVHLYQDPAKYAKVAGLDVKEFSELLKTDANGAMILFLETLNKAGGMDVLSPMFKDMGENGSKAIASLSVLADQIDFVKAQQEAANIAFIEGTSIGDEFAVQNNTVEASLEKCRNAAHELQVELGERLYPLMAHFMTFTSAMMQALLTVIRFLVEHKTTVITLTAATATYVTLVQLQTLWTERLAIKTKILDKWTKIYAASSKFLNGIIAATRVAAAALTNGLQFLTNGFRVTTAMQERWKASMAAMNFASWSALIIGIASAVFLLYKRLTKLSEQEKMLDDIRKKAIGTAQEEISKINALVEAAQDETRELDERQKLVAKLNSIIPNYNAQIDETTGKYKASAKALEEFNAQLIRQYEIEGAQEKLREIGKEKAEIRSKLSKTTQDYEKAKESADAGINHAYTTSFGMARNTATDNTSNLKLRMKLQEDELKAVEKREAALLAEYGAEIQNKLVKEILEIDTSENSSSNTDSSGTGSGYTSQTLSDKERKKQEAEERRKAAKAKKEFKEALDNIKGNRAEAETQAMADRSAGLIDYRQYLERMREAEVKYYEESSDLYVKNDLADDEDHKTLLKKKQEADDKYNQQRIALNKEAIERIAKIEEQELSAAYNSKQTKSLADELQYKEELLTIRYNKLMDLQSLYLRGSKEWEQYEIQLQDLLRADQEEKQKAIIEKVAEFQKKFDKQSMADKYKLEYAALEELYKRKKITEEQYQEWLKKLKGEETKEKEKSLPGGKPATPKAQVDAAMAKFVEEKEALDKALASGVIDENEYKVRLGRTKSDLFDGLIAPMKDAKSEWLSLMATMIGSWKDFAQALKDPEGDPFNALGNGIQATSAFMSAVFSQMTAFMQSELQIQTSAVEKRYDREIAAAEGNSYRVAKLEKEKEAKIAKLKNEANRKMFAMQVIQAVAQTATNALNAYGSTVVIPVVGPTLAPIAAAVAAAQGAVQIALIKKQQQASETQGYSKGGFTKPGGVDEAAGIVHAGEWVASQKLLASPVARPMIEALDYAQRTNTIGSLRSEDVSRSITAPQSISRIADGSPSAAVMVSAIARYSGVIDRLAQRLDEPFVTINTVTGPYGSKQAEDEYTKLMNNKSPKSRRKNANNY